MSAQRNPFDQQQHPPQQAQPSDRNLRLPPSSSSSSTAHQPPSLHRMTSQTSNPDQTRPFGMVRSVSTDMSASEDESRGRARVKHEHGHEPGHGHGHGQSASSSSSSHHHHHHQQHGNGQQTIHPAQKRRTSGHGAESKDEHGKKRSRKMGVKACVYCRRSHMVCEGGRPCDRCIKRDIAHLCRDASPHTVRGRHDHDHPDHHSMDDILATSSHDIPSASDTSSLLQAPTQPQYPPQQAFQSTSQQQITPVESQYQQLPQTQSQPQPQVQMQPQLFTDTSFTTSWPLLPDNSAQSQPNLLPFETNISASGSGDAAGLGSTGVGDMSFMQDNNVSGMNWNMNDESELGALSKFLGDLGVPSLPGGFLDVLSYFSKPGGDTSSAGLPITGFDQGGSADFTAGGNNGSLAGGSVQNANFQLPGLGSNTINPSISGVMPANIPGQSGMPIGATNGNALSGTQDKGKAKETTGLKLSGMSRIERYFLAAADQPSGPRHSRLAQVIKAKYDAGLLKPYDYIKGYERMNKWMESGRAAPKQESVAGSAPSSPNKGGRKRITSATPVPAYGSSISPESRRRILAALNGFRPKFRQIARTLTDVDLVFVEEAMERWMLEYDRAFASIHTPSCIWRRTGEIQKANQEFANLTHIPASMFRNGQLCVYELMDEDSAVRYWEGYAKIAFDAGQRSLYTTCTLKIPQSLTRRPQSLQTQTQPHTRNQTPNLNTNTNISNRKTPNPNNIHPPDLTLPQSLLAPSQQQHQSQSGTQSNPNANGNAGISLPMSRGETNATANISDQGSSGPGLGLGLGIGLGAGEEYREIKCCFSVTIRRDAWGVPVAIMGQWIPM